MLKFVWRAEHAGAPDHGGYAAARDRLYQRTEQPYAEQELEAFQKRFDGCPAPGRPLGDAVQTWLADGNPQRVVVLVHGYNWGQYDPDRAEFDGDPYRTIYADPANLPAGDQAQSWLPLVGADRAVAFAWTSDPGFFDYANACWSNPYEYAVQDLAPLAAQALAAIIRALLDAGLEVDLLAHSLGTRTAIKALDRLADADAYKNAVRRAVMMGGAEYSVDALATASRVGTDIYNLVIREDPVLDWGARQLGGSQRPNNSMRSRVIGLDGMKRRANWLDLQLDHQDHASREESRRWFDTLNGYRLSGEKAGGRGLHWAYFLNEGNRELIRDLFDKPNFTVKWLRDQGCPDGVERFRYDSLSGRPPAPLLTCKARKAAMR
ncbi:alpha/beta hydrolase [Rhodovibrio salinarum]|uniref:Alpha/beta hydrolase n=1 Tax=Rhodovibrio salinarum TaxID=1087 RepID=A0A934QLA7_9PROT|nr:alpha/beta hydrolase [Rhodovibrio salinarum]MBK1699293.1 alpha/beta hydrolase [Rhodovibrio salinarum]